MVMLVIFETNLKIYVDVVRYSVRGTVHYWYVHNHDEIRKVLRRATHLHSIPRGVTANGLRAVLRTLHRPKDPP